MRIHQTNEHPNGLKKETGLMTTYFMFKECLRYSITPFVITDAMRDFYIRGLKNYPVEQGWLVDTCRAAQDAFEVSVIPLAQRYAETFDLCVG